MELTREQVEMIRHFRNTDPITPIDATIVSLCDFWLSHADPATDAEIAGLREAAEAAKKVIPVSTTIERDVVVQFRHLANPATILRLLALVEKAEAIVAKLPKTADGVPILPGDKVFWLARYGPKAGEVIEFRTSSLDDHDGLASFDYGWDYSITLRDEKVYSARESATKAKEM